MEPVGAAADLHLQHNAHKQRRAVPAAEPINELSREPISRFQISVVARDLATYLCRQSRLVASHAATVQRAHVPSTLDHNGCF